MNNRIPPNTKHHTLPGLDLPLFSLPMLSVLVAQFLSALGDNALLIAAIALVKEQAGGDRLVPLLQEFFVVPYILLAPFVGPLADTLPKGRVMFISNGLKLIGAGLMTAGVNPLISYNMVGVGAAAYSPAKYGILSQFFSEEKLVKANGMLEGSTIAAILLGVLLGGMLADISLHALFIGILGCYALAALVNLLIPRIPPEHPLDHLNPRIFVADFAEAFKTLFRNRDARFSIMGISLFWGSGTTLRLMLFAWVPVALGIADNHTPANLMGVVSIGIVAGAALASAFITLHTVNRALWGGLLLGPLVIALAFVSDKTTAAVILAAIGLCGGTFIVPLNALIQERGHESVGAGHALAVLNFCDNLTMLALVGCYSLMVRVQLPVMQTVLLFGGLLLVGMVALGVFRMRNARSSGQVPGHERVKKVAGR